MASILFNLLEEHAKNIQIGLSSESLQQLTLKDDDLLKLLGHFNQVAGGHEAEEFLLHSVDVVQNQLTEQVSFMIVRMR